MSTKKKSVSVCIDELDDLSFHVAVTDSDDLFYSKDDSYSISDYGHHPSGHDSDDSSSDGRWHRHNQPVHFVYDAVAERTQQQLKQGHGNLFVNGVH